MKAPMKGATIGHAKQRNKIGRHIGLTEPGIIAAEPPNPIGDRTGDSSGYGKALGGFCPHTLTGSSFSRVV